MSEDRYPVGVTTFEEFCSRHPRVALAFSGGCDSAYLLSVLQDNGVKVQPYFVKTAFQADFELRDAQDLAAELKVELCVLERDVLLRSEVVENSEDRCYFCKRFIFGSIMDRMKRDGFTILVDGTNASDDPTNRPGFRALEELGVLSPLRLAGLSKDDIRAASKERGLFTHEKPNFSCLATKIATGTSITHERLETIAKGVNDAIWR